MFDSDIGEVAELAIETDNEESLGFDEEHLVEIDANNEYERDNEKLIDNEEMVDRKVIVEILGAVHK